MSGQSLLSKFDAEPSQRENLVAVENLADYLGFRGIIAHGYRTPGPPHRLVSEIGCASVGHDDGVG
jgi:hypothetical protein